MLLALSSIIATSPAFAADINLSELEISSVGNSYNIVLKTDKKADYKTTIKNNEQLSIELKNTKATENFSTIYNGAENINNVTVSPSGSDNLKIFIKGQNVATSKINMKHGGVVAPIVTQDVATSEQINLSMPISNYTPVYNEEEVETEEVETSSVMSTLSPTLLAEKVKSKLQNSSENTGKTGNINWLTYIGLFLILLTASANLFKSSDKKTAIGLVQNLKDREKEIAKKLNAEVRETLSLRNKIAEQSQNVPSINYGLRSYQNSEKNPYQSPTSVLRPARPQMDRVQNKYISAVPKQTIPVINKPMSKSINKSTEISQIPRAVTVDSKKFLESMTKIYEKNGRTDLAVGLKNNIKKVSF